MNLIIHLLLLTYNLPPVIVYISIVILSFVTYRTTFYLWCFTNKKYFYRFQLKTMHHIVVALFYKALYIVVYFKYKKAGIFQPANSYLFNTSPIMLTILSFFSCLSNVTFIPSAFRALKNSSAHSILYPSALRRSASCS